MQLWQTLACSRRRACRVCDAQSSELLDILAVKEDVHGCLLLPCSSMQLQFKPQGSCCLCAGSQSCHAQTLTLCHHRLSQIRSPGQQ